MPLESMSPIGKFVGIVGHNAARKSHTLCPHCQLPAPTGYAAHRHCSVAVSNRQIREKHKALGRYVAEVMWRELEGV